MNFTEYCWIVLLHILSPDASPSYQAKIAKSIPKRMKVCKDVGLQAVKQDIDPILAISVAYHESRFENITSIKGAKGPLGVLPQYHCPKEGKCDYTAAGISALKKFLKLNKNHKCKALAQYNRGLNGKCKTGRSEYRYAQSVIATYKEIKTFNQEACYLDITY